MSKILISILFLSNVEPSTFDIHYSRFQLCRSLSSHSIIENQFDGLIIAQDMDTSYKFISTHHHYYGYIYGYVIIIIIFIYDFIYIYRVYSIRHNVIVIDVINQHTQRCRSKIEIFIRDTGAVQISTFSKQTKHDIIDG